MGFEPMTSRLEVEVTHVCATLRFTEECGDQVATVSFWQK